MESSLARSRGVIGRREDETLTLDLGVVEDSKRLALEYTLSVFELDSSQQRAVLGVELELV
jgi:hypothetical protein